TAAGGGFSVPAGDGDGEQPASASNEKAMDGSSMRMASVLGGLCVLLAENHSGTGHATRMRWVQRTMRAPCRCATPLITSVQPSHAAVLSTASFGLPVA